MPYEDYLTEEQIELLDEHNEDGLFNPHYVEYDEKGHKSTRCMRCGDLVILRDTIQAECPHCGKTFPVESPLMRQLPNLRRLRKELEDGSFIDLLLCADCHVLMEGEENDDDRIMAQINAGWIIEMERGKKSPTEIQEVIDREKSKKIKKVKEDELPI